MTYRIISNIDGKLTKTFILRTLDNLQLRGVAEFTLFTPPDGKPGGRVWYFNRIIINPESMQKRGWGSKIMEVVISYFDTLQDFILLELNPYGLMSHSELHSFYLKFGFIDRQSGMIRIPVGYSLKDLNI